MHTMQESNHGDESENEAAQNGYADVYQQPTPKQDGPGLGEIAATVGGMLLPLLTQVGHTH